MAKSTQQEQAAAVKDRLAGELEALRASAGFQDLNTGAQQRRVAVLYVQAKDRLAELRQAEDAELAAHRHSIERQLFGLPAGADMTAIISFRNAMDRAERIENPYEASTLIERAYLSGDDVLAAAVLSRSLTAGWPAVADHYADRYPAKAELIAQRAAIDGASGSPTALRDGLAREGSYYLPVPPEVARVADIAALAASTTDPNSLDTQPTLTGPGLDLPDLIAPSGGELRNLWANPADTFASGTSLAT